MENDLGKEIIKANTYTDRLIINNNTLITTMATNMTQTRYKSVVTRSIIQLERDFLQQPDDYERIIEVFINI
jgi:hypothetical protein